MPRPLLLASASQIRLQLLRQAGINATAQPARIDEETIRAGLEAEAAKPHDIADALAEMKARKLAEKHPDALVLGCDQVLAFNGRVYGKPENEAEARAQLHQLRGQTHHLLSALVLYDQAKPIWRHISQARLTMHAASDSYIDDYLARNWHSARQSVGAYKLEEEGVRLFSAIEGDYFTILGLPLLPLLTYLGQRGFIAT
jgi:septum formation protein